MALIFGVHGVNCARLLASLELAAWSLLRKFMVAVTCRLHGTELWRALREAGRPGPWRPAARQAGACEAQNPRHAIVHMSVASTPFSFCCVLVRTPCCMTTRPATPSTTLSSGQAASHAVAAARASCLRARVRSVRTRAMGLPATACSGMPRRCWRCSRLTGLCRRLPAPHRPPGRPGRGAWSGAWARCSFRTRCSYVPLRMPCWLTSCRRSEKAGAWK